jgi:redox-sensitive bicupin YhaK (pirin superfamily)
MSAGTGVFHSEYNKNTDKEVKFLQIWIFPNQKNLTPRYDQISIRDVEKENSFYQILSPNQNDEGVWIHQNAWFHLGKFEGGRTETYQLKNKNNGVYVFILEGEVEIEGQKLGKRDGFGIWETDEIQMKSVEKSRILLMEIPMNN